MMHHDCDNRGGACLKCRNLDATTRTTTRMDRVDGFTRTALVITGESGSGSVDLVDVEGKRLAQVNVFHDPATGHLMIDVIDVDKLYTRRRALVFSPTSRAHLDVPEGGNLVGVDFQRGG